MKEMQEQAIRLHSQVIRATGHCERCGTPNMLTCAHIIKRRFRKVVSDTRNAVCLCLTCHRHFETHPSEFQEWIKHTWAASYLPRLQQLAHSTDPIDWRVRIEFLRRIKTGEISLKEARRLEV